LTTACTAAKHTANNATRNIPDIAVLMDLSSCFLWSRLILDSGFFLDKESRSAEEGNNPNYRVIELLKAEHVVIRRFHFSTSESNVRFGDDFPFRRGFPSHFLQFGDSELI
jgi:hypothetical protein